MEPSARQYYSALAPFRSLFDSGIPILTYHKIGPRPSNARLKGLYLSPRSFARQMIELQHTGFQTVTLDSAVPAANAPRQQIALTFDDGFLNVLEHAAEPLAQLNFRAIQFLVADCLGQYNHWDLAAGEVSEPLMGIPEIHRWLAAGHDIGSHTLTHPLLTRLAPAEAREEIFSSKKRLEDIFGLPIRHFCYPYGDWNEAIRDGVIEAGYSTACTTEFGVNTPATSPFALRRITARYPSRSLKTILGKLASVIARKSRRAKAK